MDNKRRFQIYRYAAKVHEVLELSFPCDPKEAIKKLGGAIAASGQLQGSFVDAKRFSIEKTKDDSFVIHLDSFGNGKFRMAEAIGHLCMHTGYLVDEAKWNSMDVYRDVSTSDAYEFASGFMMPEWKFGQMCRKHSREGKCDIGKLAEEFGVSPSKAILQGQRFGIFPWDC